VTVIDKLPRLSTGSGKAGSISRIIQATLEEKKQVFARDSFHPGSALEVVTKLTFEDEINSFNLLFLAKLLPVSNEGLSSP
jgi:hypothetical protein